MIDYAPYPGDDERSHESTWTLCRLPDLYETKEWKRLVEALQEMLDKSEVLEAHHGGGTPIMDYRDANGRPAGKSFYVRLLPSGRKREETR